jgi:hypothetical protein
MPIRYSHDRVNRRLVTHAAGLVTYDDINAHLDLEQKNRDLDRPELIDARGATTDVTTAQVRKLVQRATQMLRLVDLGPTAIVTDNDVVYGMARMYSVLAESAGANADVFRDIESATRWLNRLGAEDQNQN